MRLALINARGRFFSDLYIKRMEREGISIDFETNPWDFLEEFNTFKNYSGILIHPPLGAHLQWVDFIRISCPSVRLALTSVDIGSKVRDDDYQLDILDLKRPLEIKNYFENHP